MATENKYKNGDWVRYPREVGDIEAGAIARVSDAYALGSYLVQIADGRKFLAHDLEIEPWQPKVGERVRVVYGHGWDGEGEVTIANDRLFTVRLKTGESAGCEGGFFLPDLEPITDTLPVAEQPAALKIQAGRYYKTRDGRKVLVKDNPHNDEDNVYPFFHNSGNATGYHAVTSAGKSCIDSDEDDLIAEWVDAPVRDITAATVDAINDEYGPVVREVPVAAQQARFKVGDWVTKEEWASPDGWEVAKITDKRIWLRVVGYSDAVSYELPDEDFILVKSATPAIVCKLDKGQPLPAHRPHVHATVEAADKEAARLAELHKGQEFGVYALTGTPHRVARVYEHEWQRLAAAGGKVQAIKALRNMAALDLVTAKRAVGVFIDKVA